MRVALCDDNQAELEHIENMLKEYRTPIGEEVLVDVFHNALDMISTMKKTRYDALLLDIIMPGFSGMDAARDIRRGYKNTPIVFLTGSSEYAVESYRVRAFDYILKPVNADDLYATLNRIFALSGRKEKESLTVTSAKGVYIIPFGQLEFVEISNRMLHFYTIDGAVREVRGRLADYEDILLERAGYLKVHRSYIINMDNMKSYDKKSFIAMTGEVIPVSRNMAKEIQESYMNYLHSVIHKQ